MPLIISLFALVIGGLVLGYGADLFVDGASKLARRFGISPMVIGLTIVAFGTSAPEMAVNILAAFQGSSDLAMGNVVGSNIFNVFIVIGVCAILKPLIVSGQLVKLDIPIMTSFAALTWLFTNDGILQKWEAIVLFSGLILYTLLQFKLAMKERASIKEEFEKEFDQGAPAYKGILTLIIGLVLLIAGAKMFVYGAVELARLWGVSEQVIALTIVSIGTSLPELAASIAATLKGEREIAIGNVVGSNIFNIVAVLGISGLVAPSEILADLPMRSIDIPLMLLGCLILAPLAHFRGKFERPVGILMVGSYIFYLIHLIDR
jgi:cation:H+ antiporter